MKTDAPKYASPAKPRQARAFAGRDQAQREVGLGEMVEWRRIEKYLEYTVIA